MKSVNLENIAEIRYYPEDEIIAVIYIQSVIVDDKIVKEVVESAIELADAERFGLLLDTSRVLYVTKEARELASELEKHRVRALAVVLKNSIHREIFNLFQNFTVPPYPTKGFSDFNKAYQWLKENR